MTATHLKADPNVKYDHHPAHVNIANPRMALFNRPHCARRTVEACSQKKGSLPVMAPIPGRLYRVFKNSFLSSSKVFRSREGDYIRWEPKVGFFW